MNRADYEKDALEFRSSVEHELSKPPGEQKLPDPWLGIRVIATCLNNRCRNTGMSLTVRVSEPLDGVYKVLCGMCNTAIEQLDPMFEDDPDYLLPVRYPDGSSWLKDSF